MILFLSIIPITIFVSLSLNKLFKEMGLRKLNYKEKLVPYSGGTIIIVSITLSFFMFYIMGEISFFKLIFFVLSLLSIYLIGFIDDLFLENRIITSTSKTYTLFFKNYPEIIKMIATFSIACFINYFLNEEYWLLKSILTALMINVLDYGKLKDVRAFKVYLIIWIVSGFFYLRWTKELHVISSLVLGSYFYFNANDYCKLGYGGLNLIGIIASMILLEALSTNISIIILLTIALAYLSLVFKNYPAFKAINKQLTRKAS